MNKFVKSFLFLTCGLIISGCGDDNDAKDEKEEIAIEYAEENDNILQADKNEKIDKKHQDSEKATSEDEIKIDNKISENGITIEYEGDDTSIKNKTESKDEKALPQSKEEVKEQITENKKEVSDKPKIEEKANSDEKENDQDQAVDDKKEVITDTTNNDQNKQSSENNDQKISDNDASADSKQNNAPNVDDKPTPKITPEEIAAEYCKRLPVKVGKTQELTDFTFSQQNGFTYVIKSSDPLIVEKSKDNLDEYACPNKQIQYLYKHTDKVNFNFIDEKGTVIAKVRVLKSQCDNLEKQALEKAKLEEEAKKKQTETKKLQPTTQKQPVAQKKHVSNKSSSNNKKTTNKNNTKHRR